MKKSELVDLKILAYYQIAGGLLGIFFWVLMLLDIKSLTIPNLLLYIILFLFYSYSITCGYFILAGEIKKGLDHSFFNQLFQLINFSISGYAFKYVSGVILSVGIDHTHDFLIDFNASLSQSQLLINQHSEIVKIGFNIIAFLLVLYIGKLKTSFKASTNDLIN